MHLINLYWFYRYLLIFLEFHKPDTKLKPTGVLAFNHWTASLRSCHRNGSSKVKRKKRETESFPFIYEKQHGETLWHLSTLPGVVHREYSTSPCHTVLGKISPHMQFRLELHANSSNFIWNYVTLLACKSKAWVLVTLSSWLTALFCSHRPLASFQSFRSSVF